MLVDAQTVAPGSNLDADICIIGGGPAGLSLAQEFVDQNLRVCLLESGDWTENAQTKSLNSGTTTGDAYLSLDFIRSRQLGGTANQWNVLLPPEQRLGVRYGQYDEVDFKARDWLPHSGWCVSFEDLVPFYQRAQVLCKLGPFSYGAEDWATIDSPAWPLESDRIRTTMFQFGPSTVFTQELPLRLSQASNVQLYINATAIELETNPEGDRIERVRVACLSGNYFTVMARRFVIANSAIETARLLLMSNRHCPAGVGNQHDQVGRYFMDHPFVFTGFFVPTDRKLFEQSALYDKRRVNDTVVMAKLALTNEVVQAEQVMNMSLMLFPRYWEPSRGFQSLKRLIAALRRGQWPQPILAYHFRHMLQDWRGIVRMLGSKIIEKFRPPIPADLRRSGWSAWPQNKRRFRSFYVFAQTEQVPHPDNRVTLDQAVDRLGCPQVKLHWQWRGMDREHVQRAQHIFQQELAAAGLGQLWVETTEDGQPILENPTSHHLIGTARMHADPQQGVVDVDCKVHGVENLYVAGSALFPTGGYANPTLTIVALALRLADHLKLGQALGAPAGDQQILEDCCCAEGVQGQTMCDHPPSPLPPSQRRKGTQSSSN